jgi:hypothetical protein
MNMEYGLFLPIANNGWITSTTSPQYMPSFELNRENVQKAESYGFGFALSMIKLNELAQVEGTAGLMLTFDDFLIGTEIFGQEVMPLLS